MLVTLLCKKRDKDHIRNAVDFVYNCIVFMGFYPLMDIEMFIAGVQPVFYKLKYKRMYFFKFVYPRQTTGITV